jgi:glycogen debranching enzyme GlgX
VKMIAEPWDVGMGGYQLGAFPRGWLEWNDRFRDTLRQFWLGGHHAPDSPHPAATRADFARRLCASNDIFQARHRPPLESVNFIVAHDGFTLRDLVSYQQRHNDANGEDNRDGHGHNLSFNCGVEGTSSDPAVNRMRGRLQRALLACTVLAQGTPMLCSGDELGHTQGGNNNPYCQDNATTWIDWSEADPDLAAYTARLVELRRDAMPFAPRWYSGLPDRLGLHDLAWLEPDGSPLHGDAWGRAGARALGCLIGKPGRAAAPLLLLVNAGQQPQNFMLPAGVWQALLDTSDPRGRAHWHGQGEVPLEIAAHSMLLLAAAGAGVT